MYFKEAISFTAGSAILFVLVMFTLAFLSVPLSIAFILLGFAFIFISDQLLFLILYMIPKEHIYITMILAITVIALGGATIIHLFSESMSDEIVIIPGLYAVFRFFGLFIA